MRVEVDMPNASIALVPGMYVNVAFKLPPRGLVEVPAAALIFRASGTQVAQVDANSKIQFRECRDRAATTAAWSSWPRVCNRATGWY